MLKAIFLKFCNDVVKHLRLKVFLRQIKLTTAHFIHENRVVFQYQTVQTEVGNI